jgi:hypothetical protein
MHSIYLRVYTALMHSIYLRVYTILMHSIYLRVYTTLMHSIYRRVYTTLMHSIFLRVYTTLMHSIYLRVYTTLLHSIYLRVYTTLMHSIYLLWLDCNCTNPLIELQLAWLEWFTFVPRLNLTMHRDEGQMFIYPRKWDHGLFAIWVLHKHTNKQQLHYFITVHIYIHINYTIHEKSKIKSYETNTFFSKKAIKHPPELP